MKTPPPENAGGACNRRRLFSVNGGLVHRIGETPTRAAIQFNRQISGDALPVIQAGKKPPPNIWEENGDGFHHRLAVWRHPCLEPPANTISPFTRRNQNIAVAASILHPIIVCENTSRGDRREAP
jgi:hypothetical protein